MTDKVISGLLNEKIRCGHTRVRWLLVTIVSMIMLSYGLENGWMSPMTKILASEMSPTGYPLSSYELSWVGSVTSLTAVGSVCLYAYLADTYGRKFSILVLGILQAISWIMRLFATNTMTLIMSRAVAGLSTGGCFIVLPMYVREISNDNMRGAMLSFVILMQNVGLLIMYIMGSYIEYYTVLWISLSITVIAVGFILFVPESPAFLMKKDQFDEATRTLASLRGLEGHDKIIEHEMNAMRNEDTHYKSLPTITFVNIFKNKAWRRGFIFITLINTAQSGNGTFVIVTYVWVILSSTGASLNPELQSLVVPILLTFGSLVSILALQKLGRKLLTIISSALIAVGMASLGTILLLQQHGFSLPSWMPMLSIAICVWANAAGTVPAFYAFATEMFNFQVRSKLMGCIVSYSWFVSSMQLIVFIPISEMLGMHTMFYIFAGVNIFGVFSALLLPETKGKAVEEIDERLGR